MPDRRVTPPYPFTAIVGLFDLRMALLLSAVSPAIGGVLVRGEKGTAKSTMVRALAALLPELSLVEGCRFGCAPEAPDRDCPDGPHPAGSPARRRRAALVELPVGATEDRLIGSLDLPRVLAEGTRAYEPGLLAAAHRGMLYVDEINLLPDHLVDLLLDAAAMGRAHVERDGVSVRHAARFLLVGTMNPEEGELRPQLLDRFGLTVGVAAPRDLDERAEVVRRRLAYEADPEGFAAVWAEREVALAGRIRAAAGRLPRVVLPDERVRRIAAVCAAFGVDGMRADIVVARTAIALAAWHDRAEVSDEDVRDAARLALPHRRRRDPFDSPDMDDRALDEALDDALRGTDRDPDPDRDPNPDRDPDRDPGPGGGPGSGVAAPERAPDRPAGSGGATEDGGDDRDDKDGGGEGTRSLTLAPAGRRVRARLLAVPGTGTGARAGRRSPAYTRGGRITGARRPGTGPSAVHLPAIPHLPATLLAAAPYQAARGRRDRILLRAEDLRLAVVRGREANLVLFVVDASGSMAARQRIRVVKDAVLSLLRDAYQRRDKVGLVTFAGTGATLALPPTTSHEVAAAQLRQLRTGGRTPLAAGLRTAAAALAAERRRDPYRRPLLILVTDGRATTGPDPAEVASALRGVASVVVDCESGPVRLGLAGRVATALGGRYLRLEQLSADDLRVVARRAA